MKRFITYLYNYESGTKGEGTGFVRVDQRGREVRMEVHVRNGKRFDGKGEVYLVVTGDVIFGIHIGDVMLTHGEGEEGFRFSTYHMYDSEMNFTDIIGIAIRYRDGYLASNWREDNCPELLRGTFEVMNKKTEITPHRETTTVPEEETEILPAGQIISEYVEESEDVYTISEDGGVETEKENEREEEKQMDEVPVLPRLTPKPTYRKIQLSHVLELPPKNRHLCNNSFLIHGFFNYNFLILKKEQSPEGEIWSLGVPGVYEQPERLMAAMFGFPRFEPREEDKDIDVKEGTLGAWYVTLDMEEL